jgi:SAM-dependent methyltransferase
LRVLGYGYPQHYLSPYKTSKHETLIVLANKDGDPKRWPQNKPNKLAVCDDDKLPLETQSMDRILAVHALETSHTPRRLLSEFWRVLEGNGRLILVVPNRAGIWSRAENTPFGQGHPYSLPQLTRHLNDCGFSVERWEKALYMPTGRSRLLISTSKMWEKIGKRFFPGLGGVIILEASKQLFSPIKASADTKRREPVKIPVAETSYYNKN